MSAGLDVLQPGLASSVQDAGRPGHAASGVGRAGALDAGLLALANALCGNAADTAGIEITLRGPVLRFDQATSFAFCGAPFAATLDGRPCLGWQRHTAHAGALLQLGDAPYSARAWLALGGGIALPRVLGSRSNDLNAALGPLPRLLRAGDRLPLGEASSAAPATHWALAPRHWLPTDTAPLRLLAGRDLPLLDAASRSALFTAFWRVDAASNRVGLRLHGPALRFVQPLECISEPCVAGTVQLPPSGQPIVLLGEHPVSGGYPRIGQIAAVDLPALAQLRPGATLTLRPIGLRDAMRLLRARDRALAALLGHIRQRLAETY